MKRRFIVSLLFVGLIFSTLSFSKPIEITFWTLFSGGEGHIMTDLVNQFNKEQNEVFVNQQPLDWGEYYNKLLASMVGGNPPDLAIMHLSKMPDYVGRGTVVAIDKYVSEEIKKDYLENIIAAATFNNQLYALPLDTHPLVMYYNKNVLQEAGLLSKNGEPLLPKTFEELYNFSKIIKEETGKYGMIIEDLNGLGERLWLTIYRNQGGQIEDEKGNFMIEKDIAEKTYEEILKFYEEDLTTFVDYETARAIFISDQAGFTFDGVWAMAAFEDMNVLDNVGVMPVPDFSTTEKAYVWGDSHTLIVPKGSKMDEEKIEAAVKFAEWIVNHSYEWAVAGHIPVIKSVRESEEFLSLPLREDYMLAAEQAFIPQVKGWAEIQDKLVELCQGVVLGSVTPENAAEELVRTVNEVVE
ncbi:ABC transporter substrate-binding protein [Petrotoga sp. DB-2]